MTRDELIAYLRLERHLSLQEIGDLFGLSRQRIAQILDENGLDRLPPRACTKCGGTLLVRSEFLCRNCRRAPKPEKRLICRYCGRKGGTKVAACKKHKWKWYVEFAEGAEERKADIRRRANTRK
jgi:hypothetical protein